jgi:hypothetical protein
MLSKLVIKDVQRLAKNSNEIKTIKDLRECVEKLNDVFTVPSIFQIIQDLEIQQSSCLEKILALKQSVECEYDDWEKQIRPNIYNNPVALCCLEIGRSEQLKVQDYFPSWREVGLRFALRHVFKTKVEAYGEGLEAALALLQSPNYVHPDIDNCIKEGLEFPMVIALKLEISTYRLVTNTLENVRYVKKYIMGIGKADSKRLIIATQNVSRYLMQTIERLMNLEFLQITSIAYSFNVKIDDKTKKEKMILTVQVNDANPVSFEDGRAKNLHLLFLNPKKYKVFSENTRKNENIRKDFDAMNKVFCAQYYSYGFVYGFNVLIHSDKYYHRVNLELADVIRPMK